MKKVVSLLLALTLVLACCGMVASASSSVYRSPAPGQEYKIEVEADPADAGTVTQTTDENGNVVLNASAKPGYVFDSWKITGEYDVVSGSLTSPTMVIKPHSDVVADAVFKPTGSQAPTSSGTPGSSDQSPTSPKTGTAGMLFVLFAVIAGGAVIVLSKKQLSQQK